MQECDNLLDHVKKIKELTYQIVCLNVSVKNGNIVMTLLNNLPASYEYLITVLETLPMKELRVDSMMACLIYDMSKCKKKKPRGEDTAMVVRQSKGGNSLLYHGAKS